MATLGIQQQRIPLVDPKTGLITKEWLKLMQALAAAVPGDAAGGDVADLTAALSTAVARIGVLETQMSALNVRVLALEAAQTDETMLQGASAPAGITEMVLQPGWCCDGMVEMVMQT